MQWLGNYKEDDIVHFLFSTNATDGASITRAVNGEVRVYRDNGDPLTVAEFQTNPATGTFTSPDDINDNNVAHFALADAIGEYCEVDWGSSKFISCFRQYGDAGAPYAGKFKIQHWDGSQWIDNTVDIDCRGQTWSSWINLTIPIITSKIRVVCTNVTGEGNDLCPIGELEIKGVATTAGVTDTEDFDSLTGIHACTIDLSADAFYAVDADYSVVLQGATIDGKTINAVLAHFSIEKRYMRGTDSANTTTPPTVNAIADQVWDEILTGATHNIATSAGKRLRQIAAYSILSDTAQAATATTITLAAATSVGDGVINRNLIVIVGGTGAGQTRTIADYNNTSKVCVINRDWRVNPDDTSEYQILADDTPLVVDHGIARGGTATTITLRAYASSEDDNIYECNIVAIIGGKGRGQARLVGSYDCTSKIVTICGKDWKVIPDITSVYVMVPYGTTCTSCVGDYALAQIADVVSDAQIGSGALSCTWTQKDADENPMDNVQIWISTDEAGVNVIAGTLLTNASGQATFMLDAGTYYVWREKAGKNFTNPQEWSVS